MIDELERYVLFYEMRFPGSPSEKGQVPFGEIIPRLRSAFETNEAVWVHERGTAAVRIVDFDERTFEGYVVLLVSITNSRLADPAFEIIQTGDFRVEHKQAGEGISSSAHIIIKSEPEHRPGAPHKVALERITGLGSTTLTPFLTHVLKNSYENDANRPTFRFNNSDRVYRPIVSLDGDLSKRLREQIARGKVVGVELIDHRQGPSQLDEEHIFVEKRMTIELGVAGDPDENVVIRALNGLKRRLRDAGFDEFKVRMQYEDIGSQTIPVRLDVEQDATETLAVRKALVTVEQTMGQRHERVNRELTQAMIAAFDQD